MESGMPKPKQKIETEDFQALHEFYMKIINRYLEETVDQHPLFLI
jgi:hypothetical protein